MQRYFKYVKPYGLFFVLAPLLMVVIAHRLSTVRNSNAIMVLEDGQIIERGGHDELLAQKGRYYSLHTGLTKLE